MLKYEEKSGVSGNELLLLAVTCGGYLVFGFSENIKGPALPVMQSELGINFTQIGLLLSLNSIAYLVACSVAGQLTHHLGLKLTSILAFILMTFSGMLIFLSNSYPALAGSYFCMYLGNGVLELSLAVLGARIFVRNTATMMNLAHFLYGLSATAAPVSASLLMGGSEQYLGWRGMYLLILSLSILPLLPALFSKFPGEEIKPAARLTHSKYLHDPFMRLVAAVLTLAVLAELSVGGWLVNYLQNAYRWSNASAAGVLSGFLLAFTVSRLLAGPLAKRLGYIKTVIVFSAAAGVLIVSAVFLGEQGVALFAFAGAGIAPVYPTVMAILARRYPKESDSAIGFTVTIMGIGSVAGNFVIGLLIDLFQRAYAGKSTAQPIQAASKAFGLQAGCVTIGLLMLLCAAFAGLLLRYTRKQGQVL